MEQMKLYWDLAKVCLKGQKGQGMVEYAIIITLVAIAMIGTLGTFRTALANYFGAIGTSL